MTLVAALCDGVVSAELDAVGSALRETVGASVTVVAALVLCCGDADGDDDAHKLADADSLTDGELVVLFDVKDDAVGAEDCDAPEEADAQLDA